MIVTEDLCDSTEKKLQTMKIGGSAITKIYKNACITLFCGPGGTTALISMRSFALHYLKNASLFQRPAFFLLTGGNKLFLARATVTV